jgi:hypothetical protein
MAQRELPTAQECWKHLEQHDEAMARAFAARDTRTFGRLEANRRWWQTQLQFALRKEGYPNDNASHGVEAKTSNG